jgi:hypothetical protein
LLDTKRRFLFEYNPARSVRAKRVGLAVLVLGGSVRYPPNTGLGTGNREKTAGNKVAGPAQESSEVLTGKEPRTSWGILQLNRFIPMPE